MYLILSNAFQDVAPEFSFTNFRVRVLRGMMVVDVRGLRSGSVTLVAATITLGGLLAWYHWLSMPFLPVNHPLRDEPFELSSRHVIFEVGSGGSIILKPRFELKATAEVKIALDDKEIIETIGSFQVQANSKREIFIPIHSKHVAGHCIVSFHSKSPELEKIYKTTVNVKVVHEVLFGYLSVVLGWTFFALWGLSYYPQIYQNWRRKSVVGLSFDYIALNLTGHLCFCLFNVAMMYNSSVQKAYTRLHPKGELPVRLNDVFFSLHAVSLNMVFIIQCLIYDRGNQSISMAMLSFVGGIWVTIVIATSSAVMEKVSWLQYLYYLSFIKVGTTPIKYAPQVYLNYQRKSTEGWAIQSVLLDGGGGMACLMQMFIDAFNNDDWDGTLGNPAKLGLGVISFTVTLIFLTQHYILYPSNGTCRRRTKSGAPEEWEQLLQDNSMKIAEVHAGTLPPHQLLTRRVQDV